MRGLLDRLTSQGILLGLTTGNLETIAWEKMEAVGLKGRYHSCSTIMLRVFFFFF